MFVQIVVLHPNSKRCKQADFGAANRLGFAAKIFFPLFGNELIEG